MKRKPIKHKNFEPVLRELAIPQNADITLHTSDHHVFGVSGSIADIEKLYAEEINRADNVLIYIATPEWGCAYEYDFGDGKWYLVEVNEGWRGLA